MTWRVQLYNGKAWVTVGQVADARIAASLRRTSPIPAVIQRVPPPQDRRPLFGTRR